ncbi:lipooligosaccharide transport system permease protein [Amycolatopsis bartoniae]|uniref:Transport permease protein n=1 Tax=Amycolatopsis bartoniae TaxID=941986 RepID=A0A8H9IXK9_9PSEU|nr:ABC transporter permease [Amycolatopsis bartoniae]MBB2935789.1 lipooligosaccharide transport system permease protein [Amycolatopsis bartoniae]TVS99410.1 ABC transporter [Amycolatopsis bartoniae]GHF61876.1 transport permease protein [Amycolatopsis bartoniae]
MTTLDQRSGVLLRILPPGLYAGRASKLVERSVLAYSRMWLVFVSGVFEPLFYLVAFQIGFGKLVSEVTGPDGRPMSYVAFVAPALLASSAMNGAVLDSTFNVFFKFRYAKTYEAMLATPIGPLDIAVGEISWAVLRGGIYAVAFFGVMLAMGLVASPWAVLLVPVALLVAFAFAAIGMTCATFLRSPSQFDFVQLAVMPMFLFSTTFYPLSVYPPALQVLVQCFPLYHGVELMRKLSIGVLDVGMLGHLAYLVALAVLGVWGASRRLTRLLLR